MNDERGFHLYESSLIVLKRSTGHFSAKFRGCLYGTMGGGPARAHECDGSLYSWDNRCVKSGTEQNNGGLTCELKNIIELSRIYT